MMQIVDRMKCLFGRHDKRLVATDATCGWRTPSGIRYIHLSFYQCDRCKSRSFGHLPNPDRQQFVVRAKRQRWLEAGYLDEDCVRVQIPQASFHPLRVFVGGKKDPKTSA